MSDGACVFCEIVARRAPASVVREDARTLAFMGLRHGADGHVLVVPKRHVEHAWELEDADAAALMRAAVPVARALRATLPMQGLSLWQSNGPAAFQEVPHVHLHLMPRRSGDGLLEVYPGGVAPADDPRERLDAVAARLRAVL